MILKNLLRRKTRTFLTLLGIAIGVSAVVALAGFAEGFINSYNTVLTSSGADIIVTQEDAPDILYSAVDEVVGPQIAVVPGVRELSGVLMGLVTTPDVPYFAVFGLDPREFGMKHYRVVEGQPITGSRQILLGRTATRNFDKRVGEYFKVQNVSFRIVGIYETGQNMEENGAVISLHDAQEVFKKPNQVAYYQIKLQRPDLTPGVLKELERRFPKLTASRSATYMDDQQTTQMLRAMGWFIGLLAVLAGGLGMMNTMLMSVFERTREIGVLRALGWRQWRILRLIFGEAMVLSFLGGLLGNGLGYLMITAVNQLPAMAGFMEDAYSPMLFVQALSVALFLGVAGGLYPAWRAARLQPVEAMRYDGSGGGQRNRLGHSRFQFGGVALRNLLRQRTRTLLTTLAIGIGVGLVVTMGGMGDGFVKQLSAIGNQTGDLMITEAKASDMSLAAVDAKVTRFAATLPDVESVSGMLLGFGSVPGMPYFLALGFEPNSFAIRHFALTEGERLRNPQEIIIGRVAAKNLKKGVGDLIKVSGKSYRIAGIYETGVGYEDAGGVMMLQEAQRLFKRPNQVSMVGVKLRNANQADAVRQQIEARFPEVSVSRSTEFAEKSNDINSMRMTTSALSFISILVGGVGMMNAMLMSVYERTREIGTLRALGWRRRRVVWMIVREALLLSLLSGLAGIALGVGLGRLLMLEPTMGAWLEPSYSVGLFTQVLIIALILGAIGALYPSWRASNLSPIEALRYE